MLIRTHDISNHFVARSDYPNIVLSTLGCVQICQYMYIHLKKEFFELHFTRTKHRCTTVLTQTVSWESAPPAASPPPPAAPHTPNRSSANNCGRPRIRCDFRATQDRVTSSCIPPCLRDGLWRLPIWTTEGCPRAIPFRNTLNLISNLMYKILIYLHIIHLLKSSTCFEHYPAHPQEVCVVIVYTEWPKIMYTHFDMKNITL
jgi:hypothetical protein